MKESDAIRLRHMLDAAEEALAISAGRPLADLERDLPVLVRELRRLLGER